MKKIILLSIVAFVSTGFMFEGSKDFVFQIGDKTNNLLLNGKPFVGSSKTFWKFPSGFKCRFLCEDEQSIIIERISKTTDKKPVWGIAVLKKGKNCWDCVFFMSQESLEKNGLIKNIYYSGSDRVILFGNDAKIVLQ